MGCPPQRVQERSEGRRSERKVFGKFGKNLHLNYDPTGDTCVPSSPPGCDWRPFVGVAFFSVWKESVNLASGPRN